ncbi:hypothetical protein [Desulfurobacterium crinifex]
MANGTFEEITKLGIQNRRPDLYRLLQKIGARPRGYAEIEIKRIKRDQGIYPREATDWDRVEIYTEAIQEGAVFPPVLVAAEPENLLLDGNHRLDAHEQAGHEKIWIERWDVPKHYLKLIAQAANTEAGNIDTPLSGKEKKRAIIQDWEDGIRDVELIATALKTSVKYVRNVLSKAGLIKSRKGKMKERAKELREQGLSYREIAKKLEEEFNEKIEHTTVVRWFKDSGAKTTQVENAPLTPTVRSTLDSPEKLVEQEERELLRAEEEENKTKLPEDPTRPAKPIKEADTKPLVEQVWYWQRKYGFDENDAKASVELAKMGETNEKLILALANQRRRENGLPEYYENPNWQREPHPFELERQKKALERSRVDILWEKFIKEIETFIKSLDMIAHYFELFTYKLENEPEVMKYVNDPRLGGGWFVFKVLFKHIMDKDYDDTTLDIIKGLGDERVGVMADFLHTLVEKGAERYLCQQCKTSLEDRKFHCKELVKKAAIQTLKAHGLKVEYYKDKHPYWFIKDILDKLEK